MAERGFEQIEHEADYRIRCWGSSLEDVFLAAAKGMCAFLFEASEFYKTSLPQEKTFIIPPASPEEMLVEWLSELLHHIVTSYSAPTEYRSTVFEPEQGFQVTALFQSAKACDDIKAVTYHGLTIDEHDDGTWESKVTFDI